MLGNPGRTVSDTTSRRNVQKLGEYVRKHWFKIAVREERPRVVIGSDGAHVRVRGEKFCLTISVDVNEGITFDIGAADERNRVEVYALFNRLDRELNIRGAVTDDNEVVKESIHIHEVAGYQVLHQVCLAHDKKRGDIRLSKLRKSEKLPEEMDILLKFCAFRGNQE